MMGHGVMIFGKQCGVLLEAGNILTQQGHNLV